MEREDLVQSLVEENRLLQERIAELEEMLGSKGSELERETTRITRVIKLLQNKDRTLEQYAAELEKKREELEEMVQQLQGKNQQLQVWVSALRLYQDIIENEAAALIGLNKNGKIVLYNRATLTMFGEAVRDMIGKPLDAIDFSKYDSYTPRLAQAVLESHRLVDREADVDGRKIHTFAYPMGRGNDFRGVLLKISVQK
ncbi:MAG: PAS domain-containing protein [Planctomycetota bacterium]|jgi:PAS domain S-box-containing protein